MTLEERIECGIGHALYDNHIDDDAFRKRLIEHLMMNIKGAVAQHNLSEILADEGADDSHPHANVVGE